MIATRFETYFDGELTNQLAGDRLFVTPALPAGKDYYYTLKTEVMREGRVGTEERRIAVQAGKVTEVDFNAPPAAATATASAQNDRP